MKLEAFYKRQTLMILTKTQNIQKNRSQVYVQNCLTLVKDWIEGIYQNRLERVRAYISQKLQHLVLCFENLDPTRPSTNGFYMGELEPIDHERSKMKLKMLLQQQLKNAKGKQKIEIERRLAEIGKLF